MSGNLQSHVQAGGRLLFQVLSVIACVCLCSTVSWGAGHWYQAKQVNGHPVSLFILEAEELETNAFWTSCPGKQCGDDRSATASGHGHLITLESRYTGSPAGYLHTRITLPAPDRYVLWAKSSRYGSHREWSVAIGGRESGLLGGAGGHGWQRAGTFNLPAGQVDLVVRDRSPDGYWAYPDALILVSAGQFDPNGCAGGGREARCCLPGNHAPTVILAASKYVWEGQRIRLRPTVEDPDGDQLHLEWRQVAGPPLPPFAGQQTPLDITIPMVNSDANVVLELVATDSHGATGRARIMLHVLDRAEVVFQRPFDAAREGTPYHFDTRVEFADSRPVHFQWQQLKGPPVKGLDVHGARPVVTLPLVDRDTDLEFEVTITHGREVFKRHMTLRVLDDLPTGTVHKDCGSVSHPYPCEEVTACGFLRREQRYYLLTRDLSSPGTCLVTTGDVVIDLNGHTLTFDAGYGDSPRERMQNPGFEVNRPGDSGQLVAGWDLQGAPGAQVVSTWEMPLVGKRALKVPAGGELVSSWVYLPTAGRTYRGQIVHRGQNRAVEIVVERRTASGAEQVCRHLNRDPVGGGRTGFCNFHGQPAGFYRLRVRSDGLQYYDDAGIFPARNAGIGAVRYFTHYEEPDRPNHVCNQDDGSCQLPDSAAADPPTVRQGVIEVRNGTIRQGSRGIKSYGLYLSEVGLVARNLHIITRGVGAKAMEVTRRALVFDSRFEATSPWVLNRENINETAVTIGNGDGSVIDHCTFIGGQGNLFIGTGKGGAVIRNSQFFNRATVTNHYSIAVGGSQHVTIRSCRFNCDPGQAGCQPFSGSGILLYQARYNEIADNTFHIRAAPCDAEYIRGYFTTNAIRITDYNKRPGAADGAFGNWVHANRFWLTATSYPQMPGCEVMANGIFMSVGGGDNTIEDNTFTSSNQDSRSASYPFYIGGGDNGGTWRNNRVRTNDKAVWYGSRYGRVTEGRLIDNVFTRVKNTWYTPPSPEAAIRMGYCCPEQHWVQKNLELVNNSFQGGFITNKIWFTSNQPTEYSLVARWIVEVTVRNRQDKPVAGAQVTLTSDTESVRGKTDAGGKAHLVATEYHRAGLNWREQTTGKPRPDTPHRLRVLGPDGGTVERQVRVDRPLHLTLVLP